MKIELYGHLKEGIFGKVKTIKIGKKGADKIMYYDVFEYKKRYFVITSISCIQIQASESKLIKIK